MWAAVGRVELRLSRLGMPDTAERYRLLAALRKLYHVLRYPSGHRQKLPKGGG